MSNISSSLDPYRNIPNKPRTLLQHSKSHLNLITTFPIQLVRLRLETLHSGQWTTALAIIVMQAVSCHKHEGIMRYAGSTTDGWSGAATDEGILASWGKDQVAE